MWSNHRDPKRTPGDVGPPPVREPCIRTRGAPRTGLPSSTVPRRGIALTDWGHRPRAIVADAGGNAEDGESGPTETLEAPPTAKGDEKLGEEATATCLSDADGAPAQELLLDLAARQAALCKSLIKTEVELAQRLASLVDDPRGAYVVAKVLREAVAISGALSRRVSEVLTTATTLRMQEELTGREERSDGI